MCILSSALTKHSIEVNGSDEDAPSYTEIPKGRDGLGGHNEMPGNCEVAKLIILKGEKGDTASQGPPDVIAG